MLHKDNCKPIREVFEFLDLVRLILEILRYFHRDESHDNQIAFIIIDFLRRKVTGSFGVWISLLHVFIISWLVYSGEIITLTSMYGSSATMTIPSLPFFNLSSHFILSNLILFHLLCLILTNSSHLISCYVFTIGNQLSCGTGCCCYYNMWCH